MKHTASFYLKQIENNPEKFGVSKPHIQIVNRMIKKADEEYEKNQSPIDRIKIGIFIRFNGKYHKVIECTDVITIESVKGIVLTVNLDDITICRNQDKAHDRYTAEHTKNTEKQLKKADKEFKQKVKIEKIKKVKKETKDNFVDISGW